VSCLDFRRPIGWDAVQLRFWPSS